jgi:hypothetical protein
MREAKMSKGRKLPIALLAGMAPARRRSTGVNRSSTAGTEDSRSRESSDDEKAQPDLRAVSTLAGVEREDE